MRALAVLSLVVLGSCATAKLQLPDGLATGALRFELQQLQLFPKSGQPIEQVETGRWSTGSVTRLGEEAFTRADRAMLRGRVEYTVGRKNEELWSVKCDVSRPVGAGAVPAEAASASVLFCAHQPLREKLPPFELRLSTERGDGDAGLVRIDDEFFTIEALRASRDGKPLPGASGWLLRDKGAPAAAVQVLSPRALILSERISGWRADVLAAAVLAIVACGEPTVDAVRPWNDPGGNF